MTKSFVFFLGLIFGSVCCWVAIKVIEVLEPEYFTVRILDYSKCEGATYGIKLKDRTVLISGDQIDRTTRGFSSQSDTFVHLYPDYDMEDPITYTISATYTNCETLVSEIREVERSWLVYESIRDKKIEHNVRSK